MADNKSVDVDTTSPKSWREWLKIIAIGIGIPATIFTIVWVFLNPIYNSNVLCSVDVDACRTRVAQLSESLQTITSQPASFETVQVTVVHTVIVTTTPVPATEAHTPSATEDVYKTSGSCNVAFSDAPCTYVLTTGDRWQQIAQNSPYGDNCRYPEIMNVNRRSDGTYPRLSGYDPDVGRPITIMPAAPPGTYDARIRDEVGKFEILPDCSVDGFPCVFEVTEELPLFTYDQISQTVYRNNLFGGYIAQANLASDCSGRGKPIHVGSRVVIPKRPLHTPTPSAN